MWLGRVIASTVVRRLTLLALAAVLAWLGVGEARAQDYTNCYDPGQYASAWECPNRQVAYEQAKLAAQQNIINTRGEAGIFLRFEHYASHAVRAVYRRTATAHEHYGQRTWPASVECPGGMSWDNDSLTCELPPCPSGQIRNDITGQCQPSCSGRPNSTFKPIGGQMVPNGSFGCSNGCMYATHSNGDGTHSRTFLTDAAQDQCAVTPNCANYTGTAFNSGLSMCVPLAEQCASNETKDPNTGQCRQGCPAGMSMDANGICEVEAPNCPAGHVRSPAGGCLPGEGQCAAGEARKPDGTCGRDSDNDGEADEFDPETDTTSFSGGDSCDAPPSCSGDAIMCGMTRIQWRIECNTRQDTKITGGTCDAIPVCTGRNCNALEYAQLLQQWRNTCKTIELNATLTGGGGPGGDSGQPDWTKVTGDGSGAYGEGADPDLSESNRTITLGLGMLDDGGFFGGAGSCPNFGVISAMGLSFDTASFPYFCELLTFLRGLVIVLFGAWPALRILQGDRS